MLIFIGFILATLQSVLVPFDFADPANVLHSCSIFFYGLTKLVTIGCLCASRKLSLHGALLVTSLVSAMLAKVYIFFRLFLVLLIEGGLLGNTWEHVVLA